MILVIASLLIIIWCIFNPYDLEKRKKVKCDRCGCITKGYQSKDKVGEMNHPFLEHKVNKYVYTYRCNKCNSILNKKNWEY